jgi:uncharacterized protein (DUF2141 family)
MCACATWPRFVLPRLLVVLVLLSFTARAENGARMTVRVLNLRNESGQVLCALHLRPESMANPDLAFRKARADIAHGEARCVFEEVPAGDYVVAVVHDENSNYRLDTNFLGIPREGVGVSRDAHGFMGPPRFEDARFHFDGSAAPILVHMVYL